MDPINQAGQTGGGSNKTLYIVIGVLVVLLIGGYLYMRNNSIKNKMYDAYGVDVDHNLDGSKTIKSDYGTVTTSNKLPDNWPSDAPTYKNAKIEQSSSTNAQAGIEGSTIAFTTSDSVQTVLDFYKRELTAFGWVSLSPGQAITGSQVGGMTVVGAKKGKRNINVGITSLTTGESKVTIMIYSTPEIKTGL